MGDTFGYIFEVIGQKNTCGVETSYGLCFSISENEAKGYAVSYFKENHPDCNMILSIAVKQVIFHSRNVAIEDSLLVSKEVKEL